jgi:hypothetical protein
MCNEIRSHTAALEFVKNSLLIKHFCTIVKSSGDSCPVIPLKGTSLLFTLYKDDYARNVGDLDLFIPKGQVDFFIRKMQETGYSLRSEKINAHRIEAKGKFDMVNSDARFCDLDIHIDFVTKKFFRKAVQGFTPFALSRLRRIKFRDVEVSLLSPVDEWLYLAQHYCFHLFSGEKWLRDLYLLQSGFQERQIEELCEVGRQFHFERIITAVSYCLRNTYPAEEIKIPSVVTGRPFLFNRLFRKPDVRFKHTFPDRMIAAYWEFLFIDGSASRLTAYLQLLFPTHAMFCTIYNTTLPPVLCYLFYPFHWIAVLSSSLLFLVCYIYKFF